jgi:hypothetical protein
MSTFRKVIARPGTYLAKNLTGGRTAKTLTKEDLQEIAKTGNEMLKSGHLIPAPYGHTDPKGVYPQPLFQQTADGKTELIDSQSNHSSRWDHAINAGFWTGFETDESGALVGTLEAEGDESNPETHAGRIGKTFKQTSALLASEWTDGKGIKFTNAPLHICLTNKAVEPDQKNFEPVKNDSTLAVAMTFSEDDLLNMSLDGQDTSTANDSSLPASASPEIINKIREALKSKLKVTLPDDTDGTNFLDRFLTVLTNLQDKEDGEDLFSEPKGTETLQSPTVMSTDSNPTTDKRSEVLLSTLVENKKSSFKQRIETLVSEGKIGRKYADSVLTPAIDAFTMSLDDITEDGTFKPNYIEMSLATLEEKDSLNTATETALPSGSEVPDEPANMGAADDEPNAADVDSLLDTIFPRSIYQPTS